jgi:hypothetical protein
MPEMRCSAQKKPAKSRMSAETLALRAGVFSGECGLLHSLRDKCDPRHKDVVLLDYEEIQERRYAGWTWGK